MKYLQLLILCVFGLSVAEIQAARPNIDDHNARIVEHWTSERMAQAIPRDLVIDSRGLGYLRKPDGELEPYGHRVAAQTRALISIPFAKPNRGGGGVDTEPSSLAEMSPYDTETITSPHSFSAKVTDPNGVKSVTFKIRYKGSSFINSFSASPSGDDRWAIGSKTISDGDWEWWVIAKDNGPKGGHTTIQDPPVNFTVASGGDPGGSGGEGTITNAEWTGGAVQSAAGRIYFEMPNNSKWKRWLGYVCSGTVVKDGASGRSLVLTAAHCVYDDAHKAFARNVMFIPDQAGTTASRTDQTCSNDPIGCWAPAYGVVDAEWTIRTFPANVAWDYAFYVVSDGGAHTPGFNTSSDALDVAAGELTISFLVPDVNDNDPNTSDEFTHALGYSYDVDPQFMFCAEDMTSYDTDNWWLASCELAGGSSGGPWVQPMNTSIGDGPVISLNSWGFTNSPGMAGPKFSGTSAECIFDKSVVSAPDLSSATDGERGIAISVVAAVADGSCH